MIIDPIALADELAELLKAKTNSGGYILGKKHRTPVIKAELLLRELFRK